MSDLIRREDALDAIQKRADEIDSVYSAFWEGLKIAQNIVENIPSAELKERTAKVSNQILYHPNPYTVGTWIGTCECGELVSHTSRYCHMCGAKLDWSENE